MLDLFVLLQVGQRVERFVTFIALMQLLNIWMVLGHMLFQRQTRDKAAQFAGIPMAWIFLFRHHYLVSLEVSF